jgi:hypothetical protein
MPEVQKCCIREMLRYSRMLDRLFTVVRRLRKQGEPPNPSASFISLRIEKQETPASEGTNISP